MLLVYGFRWSLLLRFLLIFARHYSVTHKGLSLVHARIAFHGLLLLLLLLMAVFVGQISCGGLLCFASLLDLAIILMALLDLVEANDAMNMVVGQVTRLKHPLQLLRLLHINRLI